MYPAKLLNGSLPAELNLQHARINRCLEFSSTFTFPNAQAATYFGLHVEGEWVEKWWKCSNSAVFIQKQ